MRTTKNRIAAMRVMATSPHYCSWVRTVLYSTGDPDNGPRWDVMFGERESIMEDGIEIKGKVAKKGIDTSWHKRYFPFKQKNLCLKDRMESGGPAIS